MDLVGAESRKTGTRGGRGNFTWDAVREEERSYYLGASVGKPIKSRRGGSDGDWYLKPAPTLHNSRTAPPVPLTSPQNPAATPGTTVPKPAPASHRPAGAAGAGRPGEEEAGACAARRRERAIMARLLSGRSGTFAEAVRCALTESVDCGGEDGGSEDGIACEGRDHSAGNDSILPPPTVDPPRNAPALTRADARAREKKDRAARKELRRRIRESRSARRAERARRAPRAGGGNAGHGNCNEGAWSNGADGRWLPQGAGVGAGVGAGGGVPITATSTAGVADSRAAQDSSDSQREAAKGRPLEGRRRRRRRDRDSAARRKRSDWTSTSESDDFDRHRSRRRLR